MAGRDPTRFHTDNKPCEHCGTAFFRRRAQKGINWKKARFCSRACASAAKIKVVPDEDLTGRQFGRLTVSSYAGRPGRYHSWRCVCVCGGERVSTDYDLRHGRSKSCGCLQREAVAAAGRASATHGMAGCAPEYYVWASLKQRCSNPNVRNWSDYGGRGIIVCERWRDSFEAFYADMGPRPSPRHSIDRIDNDGNYEPGNCQWKLLEQQVRNRRSNIVVEYQGESMILKDAADRAGVKYSTARARLIKGWPIDRVLAP